jgi:hypothetical protein
LGPDKRDNLANDAKLYKVLNAEHADYPLVKKGLFVTGEIAHEVSDHGHPNPITEPNAKDAQIEMAHIEQHQQMRSIWQVDFSKFVAGFMIRKPDTTNAQLASDFSGVSDSRATTPNAQEFDFEAATRITVGSTMEPVCRG